jgi:hypothetical protein
MPLQVGSSIQAFLHALKEVSGNVDMLAELPNVLGLHTTVFVFGFVFVFVFVAGFGDGEVVSASVSVGLVAPSFLKLARIPMISAAAKHRPKINV